MLLAGTLTGDLNRGGDASASCVPVRIKGTGTDASYREMKDDEAVTMARWRATTRPGAPPIAHRSRRWRRVASGLDGGVDLGRVKIQGHVKKARKDEIR